MNITPHLFIFPTDVGLSWPSSALLDVLVGQELDGWKNNLYQSGIFKGFTQSY